MNGQYPLKGQEFVTLTEAEIKIVGCEIEPRRNIGNEENTKVIKKLTTVWTNSSLQTKKDKMN